LLRIAAHFSKPIAIASSRLGNAFHDGFRRAGRRQGAEGDQPDEAEQIDATRWREPASLEAVFRFG
jgi:hypothetical protein